MKNSRTAEKDKRIALVVNTLSSGGAEHVVANLSRFLSSEYQIDIILNDDSNICYPHEGNIISVEMAPEKDRGLITYQLSALFRRTALLRKLKKDNYYDAVISFSDNTNLSNVLSGNRYSATIVSIRYSLAGKEAAEDRNSYISRLILRYCCRKADMVVSCSKEISDDLAEQCGIEETKIKTVYNGIDIAKIRETISETNQGGDGSDNEKRIVTMGRMTRQKGQWYLLRVIRYLRDRDLDVKLTILGEGRMRQLLEDMCQKMDIRDVVHMPGRVSNPYDYLRAADAAVFPSLYEGFSNATLESLACQVPCISTDHKTGAREILAPNTDYREKVKGRVDYAEYGVLIPVFNGRLCEYDEPLSEEESLMAKAIERVLTDEEMSRQYREKGLLRAEELSIEAISQQWTDLIETVRR